jgi:hypothetical protein
MLIRRHRSSGFEVCCTQMLRDVLEYDLPVFFEHQRDADARRMAAFPD